MILSRLDIVDDFPFSVRSLDRYKRLTRLLLLSIIYIGILFNFFFLIRLDRISEFQPKFLFE